MSDERVTAREILVTMLSEATGKPRSEVAAILGLMPLRVPDRDFSPRRPNGGGRDATGIAPDRGLVSGGAARFEAKLAAARIDAILELIPAGAARPAGPGHLESLDPADAP